MALPIGRILRGAIIVQVKRAAAGRLNAKAQTPQDPDRAAGSRSVLDIWRAIRPQHGWSNQVTSNSALWKPSSCHLNPSGTSGVLLNLGG